MPHVNPLPFRVVVPVKSTTVGKSRLRLPDQVRARLAAAMAIDTVTAIGRSPLVARVVVVVETDTDADRFARLDATVLSTTVRGLNEAIQVGLDSLPPGPAAVLPADLPGLLGEDLTAALQLAAGSPFSVVADASGTGTTLLAGRTPGRLRPHYGPDSFTAHRRAGALPLPVPVSSSLRWDVDFVSDLGRPVGAATAAVLREGGLAKKAVTC